ncbi:MAG: FtsW/RodA/SpoVE family cell cycle protein [Candidatus Paceibacterota bacterium]
MEILKKDFLFSFSLFFLLGLSLILLSSISLKENPVFYSLKRQCIFLAISFLIFLFFSQMDWRSWINNSIALFFYFSSLFFLILVLILGTPLKGARGWFQIGSFNFQPLELAKFSLILILAKFLAVHHKRVWQYPLLFKTAFFSFLPISLVILQPDLGGAIILFLIWFFLVLISGIKPKQIFLLLLLILVGASFSWFFILKPYQKERIISFLNPQQDPLGSGYNRLQALIAIGSGRFLGKGLGGGTQTQLRFLPLAKTDFIFSALAEELGLLGIILFLIFFILLIYRLTEHSVNFSNNFCSLFTIGFTFKILIETIINVLMNLGLLPIVGIGLPFISLGGSQLFFNFLALGIISSMIKYQT